MAFTTLVMAQLFQVFDCKSDTKGIFEVNIFSNILLIIAVLISTLMQLAVIYLPVMQGIFQTTGLNSWQWMIVLFAAGGPTIILGLIKLVRNVVYGKEQYV
jgi:Ca2+-transporting ATPase